MTKIKILVSVLCFMTCFCGCVSAEAGSNQSLYLTKSSYDPSVYYSQSTIQNPQKALDECLFKVARQISIRKEVVVRYSVTSEKSSNGKVWKSENVFLDFDQNNSYSILERIVVLKVLQSRTGTEILAKLNEKVNFKNPSISVKTKVGKDGNPEWVSKPPKGTHFFASVGSISQSTTLSDAFINSDTNAIGSLATFVSTPVISGNKSTYQAVLKGVYIARRWYNSKENRYYSLAILPQ